MNKYKLSKAQGMTEYILLVFLIALVAYVGVTHFGTKVRGKFLGAGNKVQGLTDGNPGIQH
mgnify:CR=1 FL=1